MYQLKPGDSVRLKADLSLSLNIRYLREGTKGRIIALEKSGYCIVFQDSEVVVEYLTDRDVERDE